MTSCYAYDTRWHGRSVKGPPGHGEEEAQELREEGKEVKIPPRGKVGGQGTESEDVTNIQLLTLGSFWERCSTDSMLLAISSSERSIDKQLNFSQPIPLPID